MTVLEIEATVTKRGQTTLPAAIRKALQLGQPGAIVFRVEETGQVTVARKEDVVPDPVVGAFLTFLTADMMAHPEFLRPVTPAWLNGLRELVDGVAFDIDAKLSPDDE